MRSKVFSSLCLMVLIMFLMACQKGYRQVVVVNDSTAKLHTLMEGDSPKENRLWEPGRVVLFRTECLAMFPEPLPLGDGTYFGGHAGDIAELGSDLKPKWVGKFDTSLSDSDLIMRYAK